MAKVITLLTDFGTRDHYVAAVKGVILSRYPEVTIVDISHEVPPQDVAEAAYLLSCCWREFPESTVHLAVVDPGVGGERKPMALSAAGQYFVGPDNGIFTYVLRETTAWVAREITDEKLFRRPQSPVFHGRDIFAPAAAALASGYNFENIGPLIDNPVELPLAEVLAEPNEIQAEVIHVDRFGNAVTNVRASHLEAAGITPENMKLEISGKSVNAFFSHYAQGSESPFALFGSGGYLEIAIKNGSAAEQTGTARGQRIVIKSQ